MYLRKLQEILYQLNTEWSQILDILILRLIDNIPLIPDLSIIRIDSR